MSRRNSEYKRSSTHQAGLTERLLGHDAKERITSTLKALGIYKGDGGQSSSSGSHVKSTDLDLPLWDLPKSTGNKEDRHSSSWSTPEGNPSLDDRGPHLREHHSDYGASHRDDSHRVHPEHSTIQERSLYDPTDQFHVKPDDTSFGLPYHENNAGNIVPYGQEQQQQQWNESSYTQNETGLLSQEGNFSSTGGSDTNANNAWNSHPFNNPPSSYAPSGAQDPVASSFGPPWQQGGPKPPPLFNGPYNSAAIHPSGDAIKGTNLIGNSKTPDHPRQPRGLFDAVKKTTYVNPSRPNLKPLVEVTISNPAALTLPKGDVVPNRDATKLTGEGKGARKEHGGSGTKRSHEKSHPGGHERPSKEAKLLPDIKKRRPLVLPGENELKHYENDPERLPLIRKIMKGSPAHQMETLQLAGIQDALRGKNILDWKCYVCRKMTGSWQNYVSHCTSKYHRSLVHKLRTNSKVREIMRQQLLDLPSAEMWAAMRETSSSLDIPEEEEETNKGGVIHPCNSCGRFYSKADGLQRHFESEEHRQRVLFLKERFGESWQQFRWYNQATESQNLNMEEPVGVAFVVPLSGFFCKLCSQFYNSEVSAKDVHCRQSSHIKKVKEWDRTSKGSMISLSLDANEIAAAVKKNDGGSSPPRSSKSSSQRRSPSSSRQGSHSSRDRQGKGSLERSSSSQREIKDIAKSKSGGIKIPGLDLDETKDLSDVSDEEESSIKSETRSTSRHPKSNVSEKSEDNIQKGDFKLEEGELSASEVRQLEKNQETARIVKEWETREKQRHWDREQQDLTKQREEEREKEQSKRDRERKERREREDRERKEREERERQRKEKREREKLEKERQDKEERDRKEKIQREKAEKERKEKERKEREKREKEEKERKEKERIEQQEREKAHLEQEKQIQEERKRLQEAKEQLEKTRQLQEQRENDFQANQMRERAMLEKRIWEQQMRERELMEQQLRQQQLLEQQEFERSKMMQQMSGERMTNHERLEQERKERELHDQQTRERELREAELREHQEAEYQRLQREQLKEQEMRHMEMLKNVRRESDVRDAEQKRLNEQAGELREQELRTERLHQVNLQEQEERDRSIREEGYLEWQRREENMRASGAPEREIALCREMFEREVEATVVKDAERRAQQLGEVLHNPQREGDLREQVIQQQQIRERRDGLIQELREKARWELERKETDLRREGFSDREIEEIMSRERQIYEDKILEELRARGLPEDSWAEAVDDIDQRDTDAQNETRERSRGRTPDEQEGSSKRERDWSDEDEPREMATDRRQESYQPQDEEDFERHRSEEEEDEFERHRDEEEEYAMRRRRKEEELVTRQQEESRAMRSEDRDIVIHEMGGMRNVQIVGKGRLPPGDLREELRERERDDRSRSSSVRRRTRGDDRGRVGKKPQRPGNRRGRGKGWRGRSRRGR